MLHDVRPTATVSHRAAPLYFGTFLVIGLALTMIGPALSDLRERSGADIGGIGVLFVGQGAGYLIGSVLGGRWYDRHDGHRVYAGSLLALGGALLLVPVVGSLASLFAVFAVIGAAAATVDVGGNTLLMWELGAGVGRSMNVLHLCFGLGALVAPLIVHMGLTVAAVSAAVCCGALVVWSLLVPSPTSAAHHSAPDQTVASRPLLALLAAFFVIYVGLEVGFAGWIFTYGEEIELSELGATWLTTTFWIGFTTGRLLASVIVHRVRPKVILTAACGLTLATAVVLVVADGATGWVWVATAVMGLATAPQFPMMLTYLERRIRVTGTATSWFVGAAGLGGLAFPWVIGQWLNASGAAALPWSMVLFGALTLAAFAAANAALGG